MGLSACHLDCPLAGAGEQGWAPNPQAEAASAADSERGGVPQNMAKGANAVRAFATFISAGRRFFMGRRRTRHVLFFVAPAAGRQLSSLEGRTSIGTDGTVSFFSWEPALPSEVGVWTRGNLALDQGGPVQRSERRGIGRFRFVRFLAAPRSL